MVSGGNMDWGNLAEDKNKCWAVVNMVMSLWVSYSVGNFLTGFLQEYCSAWCGLFPMCFLTGMSYEFLFSIACAACSSLLVLHLFTTTLLGGSYKLLSSHYVIFSTSFTVSFFYVQYFPCAHFFQTSWLSVQVLVMYILVFSIVY